MKRCAGLSIDQLSEWIR